MFLYYNAVKKKLFLPTTLIYLLTIILLWADVYGSNMTVFKYLHIYSHQIATYAIDILIILRIFFAQRLHPLLQKINNIVLLPLSLSVGVFLAILDALTPPNYIFSLISLQYTQICLIALFTLIVWLLGHKNSWFAMYYKKIIFLSAGVLAFIVFLTSLFPFGLLEKMSIEDRIVEDLQVEILLVGIFFAIQILRYLYRRKDKITTFVFAFVVLALVFVVGDEVSWGQRFFHIETPQFIKQQNVQGEITIHNLTLFDKDDGLAYILIGFYGTFAWIAPFIMARLCKLPFSWYIPPWYCSPYYFIGFAYNLYIRMTPHHKIGVFGESVELILYSGVMLTLLSLYLNKKNNFLQKKQQPLITSS